MKWPALVVAIAIVMPTHAEPQKVGRAKITYYWTIDESSARYRGKTSSASLRDMRGKLIARTSRRFQLDLVKQGAGRLRDGRVLVFVKRVAGESRFRVTNTEYGLSTTGCPLVPLRTIAVDPRFVPLGSRVYIPQLKGAHLADGSLHDGMFIASDRGHFRGAHVDIFAGSGPSGARPFFRKGYHSRARITVYVDGKTSSCRP